MNQSLKVTMLYHLMTSPRVSARRSRVGVTLIEMLVVITISGMVLGTVVSFTASLIQWDRRARSAGLTREQLAMLATTLRRDIRRGSDVTLDDQSRQLTVTMSNDSRAVYELDPTGCQRHELRADGAASRNEMFKIGAATGWRLDDLPPGRRQLIAVALDRAARIKSTATPPPLVVHAALGAGLPPSIPAEER